MGMEVNWRDMKRIAQESYPIGTFLRSLMHFITELGKKRTVQIYRTWHPNAFISEPIISKHTWDRLKSVHIHTLNCSVVLKPTNSDVSESFINCVGEISHSGDADTPLHMKILRWHDSKVEGYPVYEGMDCIQLKLVLVSRQHILKSIDLDSSKSAELICNEIILIYAKEFYQVVIQRQVPDELGHYWV